MTIPQKFLWKFRVYSFFFEAYPTSTTAVRLPSLIFSLIEHPTRASFLHAEATIFLATGPSYGLVNRGHTCPYNPDCHYTNMCDRDMHTVSPLEPRPEPSIQ
jgi:hypothetical protein